MSILNEGYFSTTSEVEDSEPEITIHENEDNDYPFFVEVEDGIHSYSGKIISENNRDRVLGKMPEEIRDLVIAKFQER